MIKLKCRCLPEGVDRLSSPMAGDELRSTHSDKFISRISPEYLCMPSPSLEIMYTAGRSSAVSLKLLIRSFAVIRWNDACLSEAVLEVKCCNLW